MKEILNENFLNIKERVRIAADKVGKNPEDIIILGATKTVSADIINYAVDQGIINIGENRVQELVDKYDKVSDNAVWHFIGHLQTNKVKYIINKASLIHSVESERLLNEIEKRAARHGICARVLIEVNQAGDAAKFGVTPCDVMQIIENNEKRQYVKIEGLMTVGPIYDTKKEVRQNFSNLYKLYLDIGQKKYNNSNMKYLSMGMSGDFEEAILEGANIVRLGSVLFGSRNYN